MEPKVGWGVGVLDHGRGDLWRTILWSESSVMSNRSTYVRQMCWKQTRTVTPPTFWILDYWFSPFFSSNQHQTFWGRSLKGVQSVMVLGWWRLLSVTGTVIRLWLVCALRLSSVCFTHSLIKGIGHFPASKELANCLPINAESFISEQHGKMTHRGTFNFVQEKL